MKADADAYARQLVGDIKTAYFTYLKTIKILELLDHTRYLLVENIRVNERLFENDKVTIDKVYRSNAELSRLEQQYAEGLNNNQVAKAWFNFLLNRPLEAEVITDFIPDIIPLMDMLERYTDRAVENR